MIGINSEVDSGYSSLGLHTLVLGTKEVYVWGNNSMGQLGLGHTQNIDSPKSLSFVQDVVLIGVGGNHTAVVTEGGVYTFGNNSYGQLGLGHTTNVSTPQKISGLSSVKSIACGTSHCLCNTEVGLFSWGWNTYGQLGLGHTNNESSPQRVLLPPDSSGVHLIACGGNNSMVVTSDGLYTWGCNDYGQLGLGHTKNQYLPQKVPSLSGSRVVTVACGMSFCLCLTQDGVFSWGWNRSGQLGIGNTENQYTPQKIDLDVHYIISIACGSSHCLCFTFNGLYAWGRNNFGQLGMGHTQDQSVPQKVPLSLDYTVISIACGGNHSTILTNIGIYTWGANSQGQLGIRFCPFHAVPQKVLNINSNSLSLKKIVNQRLFENYESDSKEILSPYVLLAPGETPLDFMRSLCVGYGKDDLNMDLLEIIKSLGTDLFLPYLKNNETNLTLDECLALYFYTLEKPTRWYSLINSALTSPDRTGTGQWKHYLHYLFGALRKLPKWKSSQDLYRGVNLDLCSLYPHKYQAGNKITWFGFTSTTTNISVIQKMVSTDVPHTIFTINGTFSGRQIKQFSAYSNESEVLLPLGSRFEVIGLMKLKNTTMIQLHQIPTLEKMLGLE